MLSRRRAGFAILLIALACGGSERKPAQRANVVLITVDTLRPDRLGYAGSTRPTSPAIDRLAREGVVFRNAYSAAGWTLPSIGSILSGRYPKDHSAVDFESALRAGLPTLATILKSRGYDTRGYVSHLILSRSTASRRDSTASTIRCSRWGCPRSPPRTASSPTA